MIEIINEIRNQMIVMNNHNKEGVSRHYSGTNSVLNEIEFTDDESLYHSIFIEIQFSDIFGKTYLNTFQYDYDKDDDEFNYCKEKHFEF